MKSMKDMLDLNYIKRKAAELKALSEQKQAETKAAYCDKCKNTGTIHTLYWHQPEGYPIAEQRAKIEICSCQELERANRYNPQNALTPEEKKRTFDGFITDFYNESTMKIVRSFTNNIKRNISDGRWLYIHGDIAQAEKKKLSAYGTGKTYLTHAIANELAARKIPAIYITEGDLYNEIRAGYQDGAGESERAIMQRYENIPVLLIDDLFKSKVSEWTEDKLFALINKRDRKERCTVINSNYHPTRIEITLPKNGGAIYSRIIGKSTVLELIGTDRRSGKQ